MYTRNYNSRAGRKGVYRDDHPKRAYKLCLLGLTDKDLATAFGVDSTTIDYWKQQHPEFMNALRRGKEEADTNVAQAMYRKAVGYSHLDTHISVYKGRVITTEITKHYPPDTTACIFWLKNRTRHLESPWMDVHRLEHNHQGKIQIEDLTDQISDPDVFTTEELELALKLGIAQAVKDNRVSQN
jgi:hypothetical protein